MPPSGESDAGKKGGGFGEERRRGFSGGGGGPATERAENAIVYDFSGGGVEDSGACTVREGDESGGEPDDGGSSAGENATGANLVEPDEFADSNARPEDSVDDHGRRRDRKIRGWRRHVEAGVSGNACANHRGIRAEHENLLAGGGGWDDPAHVEWSALEDDQTAGGNGFSARGSDGCLDGDGDDAGWAKIFDERRRQELEQREIKALRTDDFACFTLQENPATTFKERRSNLGRRKPMFWRTRRVFGTAILMAFFASALLAGYLQRVRRGARSERRAGDQNAPLYDH